MTISQKEYDLFERIALALERRNSIAEERNRLLRECNIAIARGEDNTERRWREMTRRVKEDVDA